MKHDVRLTIQAQDWRQIYLWVWIPTLVLLALSMANSGQPAAAAGDLGVRALLVSLGIGLLQVMVRAFFTPAILKIWTSKLTVGGKAVEFDGDATEYLLIHVKGYLLSIVTLALYSPWYYKNVADWLARHTRFEGESPRFVGRPTWILVRVLALVAVALGLVIAGAVAAVIAWKGNLNDTATEAVTAAITFVLVLAIFAPVFVLLTQWGALFQWGNRRVRWTAKFWPAVGFYLGQLLLVLVTLGIWWPGAAILGFRYWAERIVAEDETGVVLKLHFDGLPGHGFGLLWGQLLLTLVTFGYYGAWSAPRVAQWFADRTWVEDLGAPAADPSLPS